MAKIYVPLEWNYDQFKIAELAGQSDSDKLSYDADTSEMTVEDVSQSDLDHALARYRGIDHIDRQRDITELRARDKISKLRKKYITSLPGQEMTYLEKAAEAQAYKDASYPVNYEDDYPWIKSEVDATGTTARIAADIILARKQEWTNIGAKIESARRKLNFQLEQAITVEDVESAYAEFLTSVEDL